MGQWYINTSIAQGNASPTAWEEVHQRSSTLAQGDHMVIQCWTPVSGDTNHSHTTEHL